MRIGILTYHWVPNFGAQLQTLATVQYLRTKGHEPMVIDWRPQDAIDRYRTAVDPLQYEQHEKFAAQFYNMTPPCRDSQDIADIIRSEKISAVIIGSDSVFNLSLGWFSLRKLKVVHPTSDHVFPNPFFGEFLKHVDLPCAALSVSSQNSPYTRFAKHKGDIGAFLQRFTRITVRDLWTQHQVQYFTDGKITPAITPDPVFLFNCCSPPVIKKESILDKFRLPPRYILVHFRHHLSPRGPSAGAQLPASWMEAFTSLANRDGYECVEFPSPEGCKPMGFKHKINLPLSPLEWYYLIKYSSGFAGMLMHPLVVALHNGVPCFSLDDYGVSRAFGLRRDIVSSKSYHLMAHAGLQNNYLNIAHLKNLPPPAAVLDALTRTGSTQYLDISQRQQQACLNNYDLTLKSLCDGSRQ